MRQVAPQTLFTFALPDDLKAALCSIRDAEGIAEAEQIRRGIRLWLDSRRAKRKTIDRVLVVRSSRSTAAPTRWIPSRSACNSMDIVEV
jgi:hypothetical protein